MIVPKCDSSFGLYNNEVVTMLRTFTSLACYLADGSMDPLAVANVSAGVY